MKHPLFAATLGLCLSTAISLAVPAHSGTTLVIDGDTLDLDGTRYRLNGIDAPERGQTCKTEAGKNWPCGDHASRALERLTKGSKFTCFSLERDIYDRHIATCKANGRDLGRIMVETGMAWAFVKFSGVYVDEQASARSKRLGIWQGRAEPAWTYRKTTWSEARKGAPADCPIKGNISSNGKIYHTPWSKWYDRTRINTAKGERWFCNEAEAIGAGWRPAH